MPVINNKIRNPFKYGWIKICDSLNKTFGNTWTGHKSLTCDSWILKLNNNEIEVGNRDVHNAVRNRVLLMLIQNIKRKLCQ